MKHILVSLFDTAAAVFNAPQCYPHAGVAVRQFEDLVNGDESVYTKHPDHFMLYQVGFYNDADGSFDVIEKPFVLANGSSLIRPRSAAKPFERVA